MTDYCLLFIERLANNQLTVINIVVDKIMLVDLCCCAMKIWKIKQEKKKRNPPKSGLAIITKSLIMLFAISWLFQTPLTLCGSTIS